MTEQGIDAGIELPSKLNRDPDAPDGPEAEIGLAAEDRAPAAAFADEEAGITEADECGIPGMQLATGHLLCRRLVRGRHGNLVLPKNLSKPGDYFLITDAHVMAEVAGLPVREGLIVLASSFAGTTVTYGDMNFILLAAEDVKGTLDPGSEADKFFRTNYCVTNKLDAV